MSDKPFNAPKNKEFFLKKQSPIRSLLQMLPAVFISLSMVACAPSKEQLKKMMTENPDIMFAAIEKDPAGFMKTVSEAAQKARGADEEKQRAEEDKRKEEEFKNPKKPELAANRGFEGNKDGTVTIVEYSDFQCPFCTRGNSEMKKVLEAYAGKVKIVFKNMPLEGKHPQARPTSEVYEALVMQSNEKAQKFKNEIFANQKILNEKREKYIDEVAKKVGADMAKLKKDAKSDAVKKIIDGDMEEAQKFGFNGTPGYLVNGVSVFGAYPFEEFKKIIDRQLAAK
jgi:protein-disulfide isomerase